MFYDLTTIGDADCLECISRIKEIEGLLSTVYTIYKNNSCRKTVITENVSHVAKCSSVNKKDWMMLI